MDKSANIQRAGETHLALPRYWMGEVTHISSAISLLVLHSLMRCLIDSPQYQCQLRSLFNLSLAFRRCCSCSVSQTRLLYFSTAELSAEVLWRTLQLLQSLPDTRVVCYHPVQLRAALTCQAGFWMLLCSLSMWSASPCKFLPPIHALCLLSPSFTEMCG